MKLQTKFILVLLSAILTAFVASQIIQQTIDTRALARSSATDLSVLEHREQSHADDIFQAIDPVVEDAMGRGEMLKLSSLITNYSHIDGILEYSIYNNRGVASYSTSRELLKARKTLSADLQGRLMANSALVSRRTADAYEIYRPILTTSKCLECHDDLKVGGVAGVSALRISIAGSEKARQSSAQALVDFRRSSITVASVTTLAIGCAFFFLVYWTVRRLITKPLDQLIPNLERSARHLTTSSNEIASASQTLAEGASEQAASLEETSASLEELSSMTRQNAENSQQAEALARQTRTAADKGAADMELMKGAVQAIKTSSDDIAKIIKTIDEIAFQTNILALNAAVEAARAGEAGMGFAVVADEVRNLAQRSAQAAKETATRIQGAIAKTDQGVEISATVAQNLNDILAKARKVDELAGQVATASGEQTQGIGQINTAVSQMDKITQANAASAERSAAAAEELRAQSASMNAAVSGLSRLVGHTEKLELEPEDAPTGPSPAAAIPASRPARIKSTVPVRSMRLPSSRSPVVHAPVESAPSSRPASTIIDWNETTMSTGVASIDSQHQELIQLINNLHAACLSGTAREELLRSVHALGKYVHNHFAHEEEIMDQHQCPVRGKNKAAHVKFLSDYEGLVAIIKRDGASTSAVLKLREMLGNWLTMHICSVDTNLRSCAVVHS